MALATYLVFFLISHQLLVSLSEEDINQRCPSFRCGHLNIGFPFSNRTHPECGLFVVDNCNEQEAPKIQLGENESFFYVKDISQDNTLMLHDHQPVPEPFENYSCKSFRNLTLSRSPFFTFNIKFNLTLFNCPHTHDSIPTDFSLLCNYSTHSVINDKDFFKFNRSNIRQRSPSAQCSVIHSPVTKTQKHVIFHDMFTGWFYLQMHVTRECYERHWRGAQCQSDSKGNFICSKAGSDQGRSIIKVAVAATASGVGILIIILVFCFRKEISFDDSMPLWRKKTKNYQNIEPFIKNYGSLAPKRYSYSQIKKMTNSFKVKLGQGGYGGVYKGRLHDGRDVAVKVLNESKGNGEEFINEVASISRTSHVNVVSLFGYCFQGRKRALIYEFVPNEMAGGRKNVDVGVGRTSEIYLPHWLYERLEVDEELGLQGIENEEDKKSARKMIIVSLWCILTNPSSRPAMNRVVEMLEGSLDSLRIPPKPFLYSSRSQSQAPDSSASALASLIC
ncbi:hypothetical protein LWI29_028557 [Acer saccharum]|uniref:Protein kinase domain-containing protein n=1 Tax=Acer saccharum TaxID=4024 RepID=A0AA39RM82_ACESA|nr:hypothetical protein LWI29_028557 [Acer saccharum]